MGFRTVVILYNDQSSQWENDPELGKKIGQAMNFVSWKEKKHLAYLGYGEVVECVHADAQTLAMIDSYSFKELSQGHWHHGQDKEKAQLDLIKDAAEKMGYRLVKKSQ